MKNKPLVSVVMSTYNRANRFLKKAIDSVLSQTYGEFELIIVDDCSTDKTPLVVKKYQKDDKRIVYFRRPHNFGSDTQPKNDGIQLSSGKYIAYIDDDVEWMPNHLEVLVNEIENNKELDLVYCDSVLFDADNPEKGYAPAIALDFDAQFLLRRNYIDTSQVLHKRDLAFAVGGFDESLPRFIDWNMWVRMMKWGAKIKRVPVQACLYKLHGSTKSNRVEVDSWFDPVLKMAMFVPTFDPAGCYIYLPHLGDDREEEKYPRVAIYTKTYDRLEFTKKMFSSLCKSTDYKFDWFVWDNGSKDGTPEWLELVAPHYLHLHSENVGISKADNHLVDKIMQGYYQIAIHVDNDCEFKTVGWLENFVDLWKRNHKLYMSPYPEGLVSNPGGAPRVGRAFINPYFIEVTEHIGGLCAFIDTRAYKEFRWKDKFLHGNQDWEASQAFRKLGYMPCYIPLHRVEHYLTTEEQHKYYPEYFKRRILEKQTKYEER
jgi:teichuronic acid biosynthesis glycosyltransferase TuaG